MEPFAAETTEDLLLGGRVRLRQPRQGYRVAIDPVLLAAAVTAGADARILDVGAGVGAAGLCLASRLTSVHVDGIELQPALAALAMVNAEANGLLGRMRVVCGDLLEPQPALVPNSYDRVMTNPPYLDEARADPPPDAGKALAAIEAAADLEAWLRFCLRMLRPKGVLTVIHRADRLDALLAGLRGKAGSVVVFPLWPAAYRPDGQAKPAKRVLVQARKGGAAPLRLAAGLVLHAEGGGYTPEAEAVLRDGVGLAL